ncbi:MAG: hypothetical protein IPN81_12925 [Nitrosomonadales bacterium]|nr:hypothetical protein [Nitrosomonadales bacterium]
MPAPPPPDANPLPTAHRLPPASHFLVISRGVFSKALGMYDLSAYFWPMLLAAVGIVGLSISLLKKQDS